MNELHWRDPRDDEPWVVRLHDGVAPVFGRRPTPRVISFRHGEMTPALIYSVTLTDEDMLPKEIADSDLMDLLDAARAEGRDA